MIEAFLTPKIEELGFRLYDLEVPTVPGTALRVFITHDVRPIDVEDCACVSRAIEPILDEKDPLPFKYMLEVSSPGVFRTLTRLIHYSMGEGKRVRVDTDKGSYVGTLVEAGDDHLTLRVSKGEIQIKMSDVKKARLEPILNFNAQVWKETETN